MSSKQVFKLGHYWYHKLIAAEDIVVVLGSKGEEPLTKATVNQPENNKKYHTSSKPWTYFNQNSHPQHL